MAVFLKRKMEEKDTFSYAYWFLLMAGFVERFSN